MDKVEEVLQDLSKRLNIEIKENDIRYFTEGVSGSRVFSVKNKYLIKIVDDLSFETQLDFLSYYNDYKKIQNVILYNEELKYLCCEFIEGTLYRYNKISFDKVIEQVYDIVNHYKLYDEDAPFGYLYDSDCKTWADFLKLNVGYSKEKIEDLNIPIDKVYKAIDNIKSFDVPKYLIHGDFGTHNFIVHNDEIFVIDPMPVVGDYLYDFYFAILSNASIFKDAKISDILEYYDRDIEYKKNLFLIVLYIRLCRCYAYNRNEFDTYLSLYNRLINNS